MNNNLSIKAVGLSLSAVLAVIYALVMFASLLLIGLGTTRSWQAAFLGIGWSTVAGFEIGLLGIVIVGFGIAVAFVLAYNFIRRRVSGQSKTLERPSQSDQPSVRSWAFRLLIAACSSPPTGRRPSGHLLDRKHWTKIHFFQVMTTSDLPVKACLD